MTTTTATQQASTTATTAPVKIKKRPVYISWDTFRDKYLSREDGHVYEWTNGTVEKKPISMDISQLYIWDNLDTFFRRMNQQTIASGKLVSEVDILLNPLTHRRPDIAFLTKEQIRSGRLNQVQVPVFVAEIVSPNDKATKVTRKVQEYFAAGVQVVWNIYPMLQEVHVYESPKASRICRGDDLCSAEQAIPGFALPVSEILKEEA